MSLYELSLNEFLDAVASKSPTPGGGSVSAVVGCSAAAMVNMVVSLTLGKKNTEEITPELKEIEAGCQRSIARLKELTAMDMQVFEEFMAVWKMPVSTDEEKSNKAAAMEKAAEKASMVPIEIASECLEILRLALRIAPIGNKSAISDAGVGIYLAHSALRSSLLNVDINLPSIKNEELRKNILDRKARLLMDAEETVLQALSSVKKRLG